MGTTLTLFIHPQFGDVRIIQTQDRPLFHANDIARALGYGNPSEAVSTHCKSSNIEKCYIAHDNGIGGVNMQFIPESEVYRLVMRSKLPEAEKFQDWVTEELLPEIRKNGAYMITREEDTPEIIMARAVLYANSKIEEMKERQLELQKQIELKEKQIEIQAPKVEYYNEVLKSNNLHTITTIAATYNMSAVTMNRILLLAKVIRRTGNEYSLTAKYQGEHIAKSEKFKYVNSKGETGVKNDLRWTEKGHSIIHDVVKRAIEAGVIKEKRGRYILNQKWLANYYAGIKEKRQQGNIKSTLN